MKKKTSKSSAVKPVIELPPDALSSIAADAQDFVSSMVKKVLAVNSKLKAAGLNWRFQQCGYLSDPRIVYHPSGIGYALPVHLVDRTGYPGKERVGVVITLNEDNYVVGWLGARFAGEPTIRLASLDSVITYVTDKLRNLE
jgi:hypothetical protein